MGGTIHRLTLWYEVVTFLTRYDTNPVDFITHKLVLVLLSNQVSTRMSQLVS